MSCVEVMTFRRVKGKPTIRGYLGVHANRDERDLGWKALWRGGVGDSLEEGPMDNSGWDTCELKEQRIKLTTQGNKEDSLPAVASVPFPNMLF